MALAAEPWGQKFRRSVAVRIGQVTDPKLVRERVAVFARSSLQELIDAKRASPMYKRFVDGVEGADETSVRLHGGNITYLFSHLFQAVIFALDYAVNRSPTGSGRYRSGWVVFVDDQPWDRPFEEIPNDAQITLTNREPYHRKIDTGGQIVNVPPGIIEDTRQALRARFPNLQIDRSFVVINAGTDERGDPVPYILKGRGIESGISYDKKTGYRRIRVARPTRARDRQAGQVMTYPAVVFSERQR